MFRTYLALSFLCKVLFPGDSEMRVNVHVWAAEKSLGSSSLFCGPAPRATMFNSRRLNIMIAGNSKSRCRTNFGAASLFGARRTAIEVRRLPCRSSSSRCAAKTAHKSLQRSQHRVRRYDSGAGHAVAFARTGPERPCEPDFAPDRLHRTDSLTARASNCRLRAKDGD